MTIASRAEATPERADSETRWMKDRMRHASAHLLGATACAVVGVLLAALPPAIAWYRTGDPMWFADYDEFGLYFPMAASTLAKGVFFLADPVAVGASPTSFPTIQFAVGILPARWLGVGPQYLGLFWRMFAGATIGASLYWLASRLRRAVKGAAASPWSESFGLSEPLVTALITLFLAVISHSSIWRRPFRSRDR
jgi:hypothetical protein